MENHVGREICLFPETPKRKQIPSFLGQSKWRLWEHNKSIPLGIDKTSPDPWRRGRESNKKSRILLGEKRLMPPNSFKITRNSSVDWHRKGKQWISPWDNGQSGMWTQLNIRYQSHGGGPASTQHQVESGNCSSYTYRNNGPVLTTVDEQTTVTWNITRPRQIRNDKKKPRSTSTLVGLSGSLFRWGLESG